MICSATSPLSGRLGWLASPAGGGGSAAEAPLLRVEVDCPWGNRFNVWPKGRGPPLLEGGGGGGGGGLGWAPFSPGVGISCVELECEAGRAKAIGRFYRDYLMARVSAPGVEGNAGNPLLVAFARHYQIAIWHAPKFPSLIVTNSC